ncbi:NADase-type glycan-binding domain-containing protein [Persicobacter diffluens]
MNNLILHFILILSLNAFAQEVEILPCECCGNSELKKVSEFENIDISLYYSFDGSSSNWCTSYLKPGGIAPKNPTQDEIVKAYELDDPDIIEELEAQRRDFVNWSCKYSPLQLQADHNSAWVEGVEGSGAGEIVLTFLDIFKPIEIWAGYGKSPGLFSANNRPHNINVYVLQVDSSEDTENGKLFSGLTRVAVHQIALKDFNGFQDVDLDLPENLDRSKDYLIAIELIDVYAGRKYNDTCISVIRNK